LGVNGDGSVSEYNIGFAGKLIEAAKVVADDGLDNKDAKRAILYLSCLACEITLKALLEQAGKPVSQIRARSHSLSGLLTDIGGCSVLAEITKGARSWVRATRVCAIVVEEGYSNATIGTILTAEDCGASKYPNEIRYGHALSSYPPELWLKAAAALLEWAQSNWGSIRV
jgi:hypothetical protein